MNTFVLLLKQDLKSMTFTCNLLTWVFLHCSTAMFYFGEMSVCATTAWVRGGNVFSFETQSLLLDCRAEHVQPEKKIQLQQNKFNKLSLMILLHKNKTFQKVSTRHTNHVLSVKIHSLWQDDTMKLAA